jgi:predicted phosphodiesterase
MRKKLVVTLAVVAMVVAGSALAAYLLGLFPSSHSVSITGGIITDQSEQELVIWCYAPEVELTLDGFEGKILLRNCVRDCDVTGAEAVTFDDNTTMSLTISADSSRVDITPRQKDSFTFAVMGDSQGRYEILSSILEKLQGCAFALLCGDLTPSGRASEFVFLQEALNDSSVPVYTTVGNHDVRTDGAAEYISRLGPVEYSFTYGGITFAVADSSDLNITSGQVSWMREVFASAAKKVIVTHAPCYDPYEEDHTLSQESCDRLLDFVATGGIDAVFTGHIHAFNHTVIGDADFVITGGAGGALKEGEHHYVNVSVTPVLEMSYEMCEVAVDVTTQPHLTIVGRTATNLNLTYDELFTMDSHEGLSSFENYYGSVGGEGDYSGVSMADLVDLVGGMEEGDVLRILSIDGYYQDFGYLNVHPEGAWIELQGLMILALTKDDASVPDWADGPMLMMMPSDGLYSNSDCEATSYEGQGFDLYPSAGARWVKNVATVQVVPHP